MSMNNEFPFSKADIIYWSCLAFIIGIFISSFLKIPAALLAGFFILSFVFLAFGFFRKKLFFAFAILLIFFCLGIIRHQSASKSFSLSELKKLNNSDQAIELTAVVSEVPQMSEKSQHFEATVSGLNKEKLLIMTEKYPAFHYGDKAKIIGKLQQPENFNQFDYLNYLAKDRIFSIAYFPQIEFLSAGAGNPIKETLFQFREEFSQTWRRFLSPPHLGIFEALVFGEEGNIPDLWKEKLNFAGVRHLAAVSGMNITIIGSLLLPVLLSFGLWRQQSLVLSLVLIWVYILMIGASASALRAGIMVSLFFLAQIFGLLARGERILVFAGFLMLCQNPLILKNDLGFQLSFLAMAGMIFWQPFFQEKVFKKLPGNAGFILSATFSAQVFVLPLVIYSFDYISLVSPLTNLLLAPIVPCLTMIGFVIGGLVIILPFLGSLFFWVFWLAVEFILLTVDWSLKIPFSHIAINNIPIWVLPAVYAALIFLTGKISRKQPRFLGL